MSRSWIKIPAEDTIDTRKILHDDGFIEEQKICLEECRICWNRNIDLYGLSHTGGFIGICDECLERINDVKGEQDE